MRVDGIAAQGAPAPDAAVRADAPAPRLSTAQPEQRVNAAAAVQTRRVQQEQPVQPAQHEAPALENTRSRIRVDEASNRFIAQVVNENNEVIRQYPPEAILRFSAKFKKLQGLLFDERV
jgi:uncharacterized FlaG/YvyC family protein